MLAFIKLTDIEKASTAYAGTTLDASCSIVQHAAYCLSTTRALINGILRSTPGFGGEDSLINRSRYEY